MLVVVTIVAVAAAADARPWGHGNESAKQRIVKELLELLGVDQSSGKYLQLGDSDIPSVAAFS